MGHELARRGFLPRQRRHDGYEMHFSVRFTHHQCEERRGDCSQRCCHTNLIPAARYLEGPVRLRPRWRLATSGTLRLGGRGACGGM
jgi:hypothetical protein